MNTSTGYYTLNDTTSGVTYSEDYIGYYTCNNSTYQNCGTIYQIKEVSDSKVTNSKRLIQQGRNSGSGLFSAQDDDGKSYYFRGEVNNNYVRFAGLTWRVMRINGDGTIRIVSTTTAGSSVYNNPNNLNKHVGYTYDNKDNSGNDTYCTKDSPCISEYDKQNNTFTMKQNGSAMTTSIEGTNYTVNSTLKTFLENWYKKNLASYDDYISYATYCNDTRRIGSTSYYGRNRLPSKPLLTCAGTTVTDSSYTYTQQTYGGNYKLKIGLLSADELILGGLGFFTGSGNANNASTKNYLRSIVPSNLTPTYDNHIYMSSSGRIYYNGYLTWQNGNYPVINLKADVKISEGNGTKNHPYVILTNN